MASNNHAPAKAGIQHYLLFLALLVVFSVGAYQFIIPRAVEGAVLALFSPHDKNLKDNFAEVTSGVFAVKNDEWSQKLPAGEGLKKYIKTDYIFDFTSAVRTEDKDGYGKGAGEWILKANGEGGLGEAAIIIEPVLGFSVLSVVIGFAAAIFVTFFMPVGFGYMAQKVEREIHHGRDKIRLQTGFSSEIVDLLVMPDKELDQLEPHQVRSAFKVVWERTATEDEDVAQQHGKRLVRYEDVFTSEVSLSSFRRESLYLRIKEFFSDFVLTEIEDITGGIEWSNNRAKFFKGLRLYMAHHFTEKYSNNVTGLAYFGAAILIVIIGVRGLKFIPATRPSLILAAISLEGALLALLAFGLVYTGSEERMDKMLKKMEDANKNQLETMKDVSQDMHKLADALVGETSEMIKRKVEAAIAEALASDENVRRVVSDKVAEKIIIAMSESMPRGQKS
jgi:hypothetical protein